jgi:Dyp-type peroxidase family
MMMILDAIAPASAIDLNREEAIDPQDSAYRPVFENLQGNILQSYSRNFTNMNLLLITFTARSPKVRDWVRHFAENWLTSAGEQFREGDDAQLFGGFYLTAMGYQALGIPWSEIESRFGDQNQMTRFTAGMAAAAQDLNDPSAAGWDPPYREPRAMPIHAMALFASGRRETLDERTASLKESLQGIGRVLRQETGTVLKRGKFRIEPFGYYDGGSQPWFIKLNPARQKESQGPKVWSPFAPLSLALARDPFSNREDAFGSYLVFRKLEQDVEGFQARIKELAAALKIDEPLAEALIMGRSKDGTPLSVQDGRQGWHNNFDYSGDSAGLQCPFHAHIRKVNPRTAESRERRIVRRGVPYQEDGRQGMLFLCFQSKIHDQFAYISRKWANVDFPYAGTGIDPLIGRAGFEQAAEQHWPIQRGEKPSQYFNFSGFVTLKGGEFFFAPSLPFLLGLSGDRSPTAP